MDPLEHLFRRESGRIVATLTRVFGIANLSLAEDVVQDVLCRALETWSFRGVPDDPAAWLMAAAKNRALDLLQRDRTARTAAPAVAWHIESEQDVRSRLEDLPLGSAVTDDALRMMFCCCDPRLTVESQIALILRILCGFSVDEIAAAFLSADEAVKKRITRAKALLSGSKQLLELTPADFTDRLPAVQGALYLLFNEGFHGASTKAAVRTELCDEAMRLTALLCENPSTATPATHALLALMFLHAARLPSRIDASGGFTQLLDQDRSQWDQRLLTSGQKLLEASAEGDELTAYHLEAAIASLHARAADPSQTPWETIISLYDALLRVRPSPVAALNRAMAVAQRDGPTRGLEEIRGIGDQHRLATYPFYFGALGELERRNGHHAAALDHYRRALALARNPSEREFLERRIAACGPPFDPAA